MSSRWVRGWVPSVLAALVTVSPVLGQEAGSLGVRDDDGVVTHLEMLRHTTARAVREMLDGFPADGHATILVIPASEDRANWLVAEAIAAELAGRGLPVRTIDAVLETAGAEPDADEGTPADTTGGSGGSLLQQLMEQGNAVVPDSGEATGEVPPSPALKGLHGPTVAFRVGEFTVSYVDEYRAFGILGPKRVERAARVDLSCQLLDQPNGEVVWVGQGDDVALDHISKSKLAIYESNGYSANPLPESGGIRLVEPVLVAGIVAGLVYLFYTNQN